MDDLQTGTDVLNYYGKTHTAYLHPKGKRATILLQEKLDCRKEEKVLEIGFGTGATLVDLASVHKQSTFFGVEVREVMYNKAAKRIRFSRLKNIRLLYNQYPLQLPFEDDFFDKLYVESVLAILEGQQLDQMIGEIRRVLKPGGRIVINEGIWLDTVSGGTMHEINVFCKVAFGIIQANASHPYLADWEALLEKHQFIIESVTALNHARPENFSLRFNFHRLLSEVFTSFGKWLSISNIIHWKTHLKYKSAMSRQSKRGNSLGGYIFQCKLHTEK
jgi:ubiquinone/menaquinone biosynthesis C-methylase UbiE